MIDMNFMEFLALSIVSLIAAWVVHYLIHYRYFQHLDGFFWDWIGAWVFAWVASPVLGHWVVRLRVDNVYLIPALLGGFIGAFCATAIWKGISVPHQKST
jgi:uncharacterized membrane protein YeaQ/YmgE (transglycosylase-associated protein family)